MIRTGLLAVGLCMVLASCSRIVSYQAGPPQVVGNQPGDTIEVIPGAINKEPVSVVSVVRAYDDNGKLNICGAILFSAKSNDLNSKIGEMILDPNSYLLLGGSADKMSHVSISPKFMRPYAKIADPLKIDTSAANFSKYEGNCVSTNFDWKPEFKSNHKLTLVHTTYTYQYVPTYVPRRK